MTRTVTITSVRFLPEDVYEGSLDPKCYENARSEVFTLDDEDAVDDAVRILRAAGLEFEGFTQWASNPDGSVDVDYATGEREEVTGHLDGWTPVQIDLIRSRTNDRSTRV